MAVCYSHSIHLLQFFISPCTEIIEWEMSVEVYIKFDELPYFTTVIPSTIWLNVLWYSSLNFVVVLSNVVVIVTLFCCCFAFLFTLLYVNTIVVVVISSSCCFVLVLQLTWQQTYCSLKIFKCSYRHQNWMVFLLFKLHKAK